MAKELEEKAIEETRCPYREECVSKVVPDCIRNYKECMVYGFYEDRRKQKC